MRRRKTSRIKTVVTLIAVAVIAVVLTKFVLFFRSFTNQTGLTPGTVWKLIFDKGVVLKNHDNRTNILVLGIGGNGHTGSDLTDTMIVVSLHATNRTMSLISLPRDLWSDTLRDKINSAYHYGEEKKEGGGMALAKTIASEVTGLAMHYVIVVDFAGFTDIIDLIGGIDITVPKTFTDTKFPVAGKETDECEGDATYACRYETITFASGLQHMDGKTALKYVRSRHADDEEGSDFARSRRQQDVLLAIKEKLVTGRTWTSPANVSSIVNQADQATSGDMNIGEILTVGKIAATIQKDNIRKISFEQELYEPPLWRYGRYVLVPKSDFESLHAYIAGQLE